MILTKEVTIEINKGNLPYYKKFDKFKNIKYGDIVEVDMKYLSKSNCSKIKYKCDICGKEIEISYSSYNDPRRNKEKDVCKSSCSNEKRENTNINLYDVKNCFQNVKMKETAKETMIERYGVNHNMKIEKCKSDRKETYIKNWGVDNPSKNEEIKKKKEKTCFKNFGVSHPFQSDKILEKSYKTNYIKYGVKIAIQNPIILDKVLKFHYKTKKYKDTKLTYQSKYELDFLDKFYDKLEIKNGMTIRYNYKNKKKIYYPDFYLPKYNLIIEIKGSYTYKKELGKNLCKRKSSITQGYNFLFLINKKYDMFIKNINYQSP